MIEQQEKMNSHPRRYFEMQKRKSSDSVFQHRRRVFRFEHKVLLLNIEDNGSIVLIKEMNRLRTYSIRIDFGGVYWLMESLKSATQQFKDRVFFSRYLASYAIFTLEKYTNKNGSFIRLLEIRKGTVTNIVIFPAGPKGNGWCGLADLMHSLLFSSSSSKMAGNNKEIKTTTEEGRVEPGRKVEGSVSYVDAVKNSFPKKSPVNNINNQMGRQPITEAKESHVIDWKRVVVCTRENLWHTWNGIQSSLNRLYNTNFQLKPFLPNKAILICGSEEEAEVYGEKNLVFLSGPYAIRLQRWDEKEVYQLRKIACTRSWINIHGLPTNWWTEKVFQVIGERCGGLLEVDNRTKKFQNLLMARIKVRGNSNGFIPATMMIYTTSDSEYFAVTLTSTSKLKLERRKFSRNLSSGGLQPMNFPPVTEGEEEVVLENSAHKNEMLAQDKNILETPMYLTDVGEMQEMGEDRLGEDDFDYESSSFLDDVSSMETVVEDKRSCWENFFTVNWNQRNSVRRLTLLVYKSIPGRLTLCAQLLAITLAPRRTTHL
ncbi:hypothetical protein LguiB_020871 [Lonicera macranthoides]